MENLRYVARGGVFPKDAPSVYIINHDEDRGAVTDAVVGDIIDARTLVVWLREGEVSLGDDSPLSDMSLAVAVVTPRLLSDADSVAARELEYFKREMIPVLPILASPVDLDEYGRVFGSVQFLDRLSEDETSIEYSLKLSAYLEQLFVSGGLRDRVRASFDSYIFLSYRKVDRAAAHALMRRIHDVPGFSDVAIWYDEFLRPGEEFDRELRQQIERASLFALAITPKLLEEGNYVLREEYPLARSLGKNVLGALAEPTDEESLSRVLPDVKAITEENLAESLKETLGESLRTDNDNDCNHSFLMGMAYLHGIDVERDRARGIKYLKQAVNQGSAEAAVHLSGCYEYGLGVQVDFERAELILQIALVNHSKNPPPEEEDYLDYYLEQRDIILSIISFARRRASYSFGEKVLAFGQKLSSSIFVAIGEMSEYASLVIDYAVESTALCLAAGNPEGVIECALGGIKGVENVRGELSAADSAALLKLRIRLAEAYKRVGKVVESKYYLTTAKDEAKNLFDRDTEGRYILVVEEISDASVRLADDLNEKFALATWHFNVCNRAYDIYKNEEAAYKLVSCACGLVTYAAALGLEETDALLASAEMTVDELNSELKSESLARSFRQELLRLRAVMCSFKCDHEECIKARKSLSDMYLESYNEAPSYHYGVILSIEYLSIAEEYAATKNEAERRVYLAKALRYATEAVEMNPSPEGYRFLSNVYDEVSKLKCSRSNLWIAARKYNAESHTAYTVTEESEKRDYLRQVGVKREALIIGASAIALSLILILIRFVFGIESKIFDLAAVAFLIGGVGKTVEMIFDYLRAVHDNKRRIRTEIGELSVPDGYEDKIREYYKVERILSPLRHALTLVGGVAASVGALSLMLSPVVGALLLVGGGISLLASELIKQRFILRTDKLLEQIARI